MTLKRTLGLLATACCTAAIGACGGGDGGGEEPTSSAAAPGAAQTTERAAPAAGSSDGESCQDVRVLGHQAVDVRARGTKCSLAESVAAAAEGRGRAAYESGGFACTPRDASGGDTNYSCSMGSAKVTFLYGTS